MNETFHRWQDGAGTEAQEHSEGFVARTLEQQTAKLPSDWWLWGSLAAMGCSCMLYFNNKKEESIFVGQWAHTFLLMGLYNKLVKVAGSDRVHTGQY